MAYFLWIGFYDTNADAAHNWHASNASWADLGVATSVPLTGDFARLGSGIPIASGTVAGNLDLRGQNLTGGTFNGLITDSVGGANVSGSTFNNIVTLDGATISTSNTFNYRLSLDNGLTWFYPSGAYATITGIYCSLNDLNEEFGQPNIVQWSNLDNTSTTFNTPRIQRALNYADSEINGTFLFGPYTEPLTPTIVGPTVNYWACVIAGVKLYNARGQLDMLDTADGGRKPYNKYAGLLAKVYADMDRYKAGQKRMDAARPWPVSSAPVVVG